MSSKLTLAILILGILGVLTAAMTPSPTIKFKRCYTPEHLINDSGEYEVTLKRIDIKDCNTIIIPISVNCAGVSRS